MQSIEEFFWLKIFFVRSGSHFPTGLGEKHFVLPNDSFDKITLKKQWIGWKVGYSNQDRPVKVIFKLTKHSMQIMVEPNNKVY